MPGASPRGTYLVIADALRKEIKEGWITAALPSEAQLMRDHNVSRTTVRRALALLQDEGLIRSVPGAGRVVSGTSDQRPLVERMTELITATPLAVGDPYPSEARLCEHFEASRTAVRRALAQMEGQGLLATVQGKGRTVRALPASSQSS
ncbi:GntR family transcriptional regulator [Streptomyces hygroscopicus subsp. hygroscopicus]|uniref:GntR family transcriptional regulator n=1 Tax=Streptomyces hygroscopicus TaxID=1912 RepID=UPI001C65CD4D|nr:GntR family transcriptional regulator [Streptomyces hygroscopicus]MBW8088510.1 GntR family transcriptional regulator [Streptomyces hygroscopicus subsp. hygroscopicus]